jgi:hypothetical protein
MPPRCSDELEAAAAPAGDPFATLPHALALALFALLPVDQRLRCAEVCPAWRAMLSDVSLWLRLDLSPAGGVARATDALVRAAAARAAGGLRALDLTDCVDITQGAMRSVAAENAGALVELRMAAACCVRFVSMQQLEALLHAAPLLRVLEADADCGSAEDARRVLRNEAPFRPLRVHSMYVSGLYVSGVYVPGFADAAAVRSCAEDAAAHASLTGLAVSNAPLNEPDLLDAIVDLALHCRLTYLVLHECGLSPASAPALARLVGGSALSTLALCNHEPAEHPLLDEPAALLLGNALRANTTLTSATFKCMELFNDAAAVTTLLGALTAHPSLQKLDLSYNYSDDEADDHAPAALTAAGAALGTLVAANAPALRELRLQESCLTDAGLGPLVDALQGNTHLRVLVFGGNAITGAFERERLLPAVRANPWLEAKDE